MREPCESYMGGQCGCYDAGTPEMTPSGCDPEGGSCNDEFDPICDNYAPEDTHCGDCGKKYENCDCED